MLLNNCRMRTYPWQTTKQIPACSNGGFLALEGELTPILVQMVKSANMNGLLDNDNESSKYQSIVKEKLQAMLNLDRDFTEDDYEKLAPTEGSSLKRGIKAIVNPLRACNRMYYIMNNLREHIKELKQAPKAEEIRLYHGESWELMTRRWSKLLKDFKMKNNQYDISKVPDIYDCIKYDLLHNNKILRFKDGNELHILSKAMADIVIPQEYGITKEEKLMIGQCICAPLLRKIMVDLQRNVDEDSTRLDSRYSEGVSTPHRHVRTRLYFTSESHIHSLLTIFRYGGMLDPVKDPQWSRAMEYVNGVSELNYMSQIVIMMYEDPSKDPASEDRFHVELHFSPGAYTVGQDITDPAGPGFKSQMKQQQCEAESCSLESIKLLTALPTPPILKMSNRSAPVLLVPTDQSTTSSLQASNNPTSDILQDMITMPDSRNTPDDSKSVTFNSTLPVSESATSMGPHDDLVSLNSGATIEKKLFTPTTISEPVAIRGKSRHRHKSAEESLKEATDFFAMDADGQCADDHGKSNVIRANPSLKKESRRHSYEDGLDKKDCNGSKKAIKAWSDKALSSTAEQIRSSFLCMFAQTHLDQMGVEGWKVPSIRPLETLHNALTLRQMELFMMSVTEAAFRTPIISPSHGTPLCVTPRGRHPVGMLNFSQGYSSGCSSSGPSSPNSISSPDIFMRKLKQLMSNSTNSLEAEGLVVNTTTSVSSSTSLNASVIEDVIQEYRDKQIADGSTTLSDISCKKKLDG